MKPSDATPRPWTTATLAALALGASGCLYETTNVVEIPVLKTDYPVSASPHYVDANGDVVRKTDYKVIERFDLEKKVESPRHDKTETTLHLEPELDAIVKRTRGDAITGLTIDALSYDPGSNDSSAVWQIMGWTFAPFGLALTGLTIGIDKNVPTTTSTQRDAKTGLYVAGGTVLGFSVLCFVLGAVLRSPAVWQYAVSGQVVRRLPAVPPPSPPPAEPPNPPPTAAPSTGAPQAPAPPPAPPKKRVLD